MAGGLPQILVEPPEKPDRRMVPGPMKVIYNTTKRF